MQIMPQYAGLEVLEKVTGKPTKPSPEYLYDPANNIMIGATYLQLLRDQYFTDIKDDEKRRYLITCSYNWGPHRIKKALSKKQLSTRVPAGDLFNKLQVIAPAETQEYLRRVTQYTKDFQGKD
jgi:membrane-bound lytic murein transglycosylase C